MKKRSIYLQNIKRILVIIGIGSIINFPLRGVQPTSVYAQVHHSSQTQIPSVSQKPTPLFTTTLHTVGSLFGNTERGIGTGVKTLAATVAGIPGTGGKVFHHISQSLLTTEKSLKKTFARTANQVIASFSFLNPNSSSTVVAQNTPQGMAIDTSQHQVLAAQSIPQKTIVSVSNNGGTIRNISTTATNILHNSSFEEQTNEQPRDWNYQLDSNTGNTFISHEGNRSGVFGLKFLGGGTGNRGISQPTVKTVPGRTYTFSFYMKTTNAPGNTTLRFGFWDEYHNTEGQMKSVAIPATEDWTRYSVTIATPGFITDPKNEFPLIEVEGLTIGAVYVDDAQLEEGSVLTTYNSAQAQTTIAGDGSVGFSTGGDVYPITNGTGSVGTITNKFSSLNLSNATIDNNGNLSLNGGFTANGTGCAVSVRMKFPCNTGEEGGKNL